MLPILLALAFTALIFIVVIAGIPDEFRVARSITISAPQQRVFSHVNDLHKWKAWSPWAKRDPNARNTFSGADAGVGAVMEWDGHKEVGAGKMTITESQPSEMIGIRLDFVRPFQATNTVQFHFKSAAAQTIVSWTMTGNNTPFFKVFNLFVNTDEMCGKDFEKGLASLKSVVEGDAG